MKNNKGFSLIELLIVVAIILVICAIAIPNLLRARMSANESAAAATVRNIHNSQATYLVEYSSAGYADTLVKLGPGTPCDQTHACLLDEILGCAGAPCTKGGYKYFVGTADAAVPHSTYIITATPRSWGSSGAENYCGIEDGVVRYQLTPSGPLGAALAYNVCGDSAQYPPLNK